jgi:hypothetical protein
VIYEYAVEPDLLVDWAIEQAGLYVDQFGMDRRRLVSDFPRNWKGWVVEALYRRFGDDDSSLEFQSVQPFVDAYLQEMCEHMVCGLRPAPRELPGRWLEEVLAEHRRWPFKAIVARDSCGADCADVVTPKVMNDLRDKRWRIATVSPTVRSGVEIASALGPLIHISRQIFLIDPYFQANRGSFVETFEAIVREALARPRGDADKFHMTVVSGVEWAGRGGVLTDDERVRVAKDMHQKAKESLPRYLPQGTEATFYCLAEIPDSGNPLHNRYILTDAAGVILPHGTAADNSSTGAKDDLQPMQQGIYRARWRQYADCKGAILAPERIAGTARN